jgi:molybdopterin-guanine dinucleotide biosynthesis protein A
MNAAIILCGGYSRRLGRDKCQIRLGSYPLLGHVLRAVRTSVATVKIVGRQSQTASDVVPPEFRGDVQFIRDEAPDLGPLEGLRSGLASLSSTHQFAFACGCDSPLITPAFIDLMFRQAAGFDAAVAVLDAKILPLPAVYHVSVARKIEAAVAARELSLWRAVERLHVNHVPLQTLEQVDPNLESLINVNDDSTLESVAAIMARRPSAAGEESA